jgi:acetyltransferase-like isoleucine patch superfamily enzyme
MAFLPLRPVPLPGDTDTAYRRWLGDIEERLADPGLDRNAFCRQILTDIYYPQYRDAVPDELPSTTRIALMQMDPANTTLEPEYYAEIDVGRYAPRKPLLWLWEMFDKSPLGENVDLGVRFRRILARHVFARCGRNFKCFHFVKFSFGYGLEVGDDVVVHRHVLLDDRGGIVLGNRASVSDFANIYSHAHDISDGRVVTTPRTVIGDGVRLTYHATVMAGVHLEADSMVGALGVATKHVGAGEIAVGIPAVPKLRKEPLAQRRLEPPTTDPLAGT